MHGYCEGDSLRLHSEMPSKDLVALLCLAGWYSLLCILGFDIQELAQVVLEEGQNGQSKQVPLTVQGLTSSGYLKAIDQGGQHFELHPDGNR